MYTHTWDVTRDLTPNEWDRLVESFSRILSILPQTSMSAGGYYSQCKLELTPVEVTPDAVSFNGVGNDLSCGEFYFARTRESRGMCITGRRPYDLAVTSFLLLAERIAPDAVSIQSDGLLHGKEWQPAHELLGKALIGDALVCAENPSVEASRLNSSGLAFVDLPKAPLDPIFRLSVSRGRPDFWARYLSFKGAETQENWENLRSLRIPNMTDTVWQLVARYRARHAARSADRVQLAPLHSDQVPAFSEVELALRERLVRDATQTSSMQLN